MASGGSPASPGQGSRAGSPSLASSLPLTAVLACLPALGYSCGHSGQLLGRDDNDPRPTDPQLQLHGTSRLWGAAAVPENTVKVQAASQARHCLGKGQAGERCRNKPAAAGAGDSGERLLAYQDRPFEERRHSRRTSLCSSTAPAAATARGEKAGGDGVAVGGKCLKRRRIQLHRDFLDGRNLPVWGCQPGGVTPASLRVEGRAAAQSCSQPGSTDRVKNYPGPFQRGDIQWSTNRFGS